METERSCLGFWLLDCEGVSQQLVLVSPGRPWPRPWAWRAGNGFRAWVDGSLKPPGPSRGIQGHKGQEARPPADRGRLACGLSRVAPGRKSSGLGGKGGWRATQTGGRESVTVGRGEGPSGSGALSLSGSTGLFSAAGPRRGASKANCLAHVLLAVTDVTAGSFLLGNRDVSL